jgi:hypothetical protein
MGSEGLVLSDILGFECEIPNFMLCKLKPHTYHTISTQFENHTFLPKDFNSSAKILLHQPLKHNQHAHSGAELRRAVEYDHCTSGNLALRPGAIEQGSAPCHTPRPPTPNSG